MHVYRQAEDLCMRAALLSELAVLISRDSRTALQIHDFGCSFARLGSHRSFGELPWTAFLHPFGP